MLPSKHFQLGNNNDFQWIISAWRRKYMNIRALELSAYTSLQRHLKYLIFNVLAAALG